MLVPINLKQSKSVALSIIKTNTIYSVKPCTIVNSFGNIIDSSSILTKESIDERFSPIPIFDFNEKFTTTGEDLLNCIKETLDKLKDEFN